MQPFCISRDQLNQNLVYGVDNNYIHIKLWHVIIHVKPKFIGHSWVQLIIHALISDKMSANETPGAPFTNMV